MTLPFGIISDTHNHAWSTFGNTLPNGVNDRLQFILDETIRAAETVKAQGGKVLVHTGDVFHVRGSVAPSVLNPTVDAYRHITKELGVETYLIAGNHDLEGNNSSKLGNAGEALAGAGVHVVSEPFIHHGHKFVLIPYYSSNDRLREVIKEQINLIPSEIVGEYSLFIHAPLNGVIIGIPDHGFSSHELAAFGFKSVFCGHYHNHKSFGNVYSVGALTHQTFGDIGSKAGFLIVDGGKVTHYTSNAPRFVDYDTSWDEIEEVEYVTGNYVRARLENASNEDVVGVRNYLTGRGARAVQIIHIPKTEVTREVESTVEAGASIRVSLNDWCGKNGYDDAVSKEAQSILDEVESKA